MAPGDLFLKISKAEEGLPWWLLEAKNLPTMQPGFYPWVGKIPWRRKCNPLQYSCLENSMDGGAKSDTTERLHLGHSVAVNFIDLLALHISKCSYSNSMTF